MLSRKCPTCEIEILYRNSVTNTRYARDMKENSECVSCNDSLVRNCPSCDQVITYTGKCTRRKARKLNEICQDCKKKTSEYMQLVKDRKIKKRENQVRSWTPERRKERSEKYTGSGNSFYGKKHKDSTIEKLRNKDFSYMSTEKFSNAVKDGMQNSNVFQEWKLHNKGLVDHWKKTLSDEEVKQRELKWRTNISAAMGGEGNPMFGKPAPFRAGNGIQGWYGDFYFRSLRELSFVLQLESEDRSWKSGETLRIPYELRGKNRNYFPDFIVDEKEIVECKPAHLHATEEALAKASGAQKYCAENGMKYAIVDPICISIDALKELVENKTVTLGERSARKLLL